MCASCGKYRGKLVLDITAKAAKREAKRKKGETAVPGAAK